MSIFSEILSIYLLIGAYYVFQNLWTCLSMNSDIAIRFRNIFKNHPIITSLVVITSVIAWPLLLL